MLPHTEEKDTELGSEAQPFQISFYFGESDEIFLKAQFVNSIYNRVLLRACKRIFFCNIKYSSHVYS
jgi:hypothetical protein